MAYYINVDAQRTGPFDLITMLKKIRNGSVLPETLVSTDTVEAQPAGSFEELRDVFVEISGGSAQGEALSGTGISTYADLDLKRSLLSGFAFLQTNMLSITYGGLTLILILVLAVLFSFIYLLGNILAFIGGYIIYAGYTFYILKNYRGQHVNAELIVRRTKQNFMNLGTAGLIALIAFSAAVSLAVAVSSWFILLAIPGLFVFTLFCFTPFLIMDQNLPFGEALRRSKDCVLGSDLDDFGVLFALTVINFVAGMAMLFPLAVSLPLTTAALAEIYDERFGK